VVLDFVRVGKLTKPADFVVAMNSQELNQFIHESLLNTDGQQEISSKQIQEAASSISSLLESHLNEKKSDASSSPDAEVADQLMQQIDGIIFSSSDALIKNVPNDNVVGEIAHRIISKIEGGHSDSQGMRNKVATVTVEDISAQIDEMLGH
jgi:hypothetical protein